MDPVELMPLAATLGITFPTAEAGCVKARMEWRAELCTTGGVLHGGTLMALGDSAGGLCAFLNLPTGSPGTTTVSSSTAFLAACRGGIVEATATPLKVGRTVIAIDVAVRDGDGRLLATMTQSQLVLSP